MKRRRDGGAVALVLTLFVLVILAILISQMTISSLHSRTVSENHLSDLQNTWGARSGYHQGVLFLQADLDLAPDVDSSGERWAQPVEFSLGKAGVKVDIVDSERFINLSRLVNEKGEPNLTAVEQLRRLCRALRHPPDLADRIVDYLDADTQGEFESRARNERLYNLEELLRIEGVTPLAVYGGRENDEERKGLREFVTIWPRGKAGAKGAPAEGPALVNVNTAPSEVLQSLHEQMTPGIAEAIVTWRKTPGPDGQLQAFQKAEDLKKVTGMSDDILSRISDQITVKSSTYEIRVRSAVGNVEKGWTYVVRRSDSAARQAGRPAAEPPPPAITLLEARPLNDFITVQPPELEK